MSPEQGNSKPVPDPTKLTTEQTDRLRQEMHREVTRVETLLRTELEAHVRQIEQRFQMNDERRVELSANIKETLDKNESAVNKLDEARRRDVDEIKERLSKIEGQFVTRDSIEHRLQAIEFGAPPKPSRE